MTSKVDSMRNSSLYIAISGEITNIDLNKIGRVDSIFKDIFGCSATKLFDVTVDEDVELVYEIKSPVVKNEDIMLDFFEDLEILFEELQDFSPHFTQLETGGSYEQE